MESTQPGQVGETSAAEAAKPMKLALIPLRSAAISKTVKQPQQPLEAKQFPIVLGRTNLSQWWYESCDCQQYYCRLHCRPVAKNIGSLSKVMIQIDTQGNAHIVGKNPHLVTITSSKGETTSATNNTNEKPDASNVPETNNNITEDQHHQVPKAVVLGVGDILSIGRRDREPWMRFQVVNAANLISLPNANKKNNGSTIKKNLQRKAIETLEKAASQGHQEQQKSLAQAKTNPTTNDKAKNLPPQSQQKNSHHDAQLPEWITTTTTSNSNSANRRSATYHNNTAIYGSTTDTKEQQRHQAMVATLTKAAVAAGAAADADERNKSKKPYRYNSYYNYYNQNNNNNTIETATAAATTDPTQNRRKRRHNTSSFAPFIQPSNSYHKPLIRSAEDLFHNGSSRRGGRFHHNGDPQIHLVFQDFETSAELIKAGTLQGRNKLKAAKNGESPVELQQRRKQPRTDRNFIGKPNESQESKSVGLLSKNYAAALLEVSTPSLAPPADMDEDAEPPLVPLPDGEPGDRV